jgi:hypothetical protein
MRAPPEAVTTSRGSPRSAPRSQARASFSPTTAPMLPPMKAKSMIAATQAWPSTASSAATMASPRPVSDSARRIRTG